MEWNLTEQSIVIATWLAVSLSYAATGYGFWRWAKFLTPYNWPLQVLSGMFWLHGFLGLAQTALAAYAMNTGGNPVYQNIGALGYSRMALAVLFAWFIAGMVLFAAYRFTKIKGDDKELLLTAYRVFFRLEKAAKNA